MSEKERKSGEEGGDPGFVVVDKRGTEEELETPSEAAAAADPPPRELPKPDFSGLVISLGTSALLHLGIVADPESGEAGAPDLALARQTIDTIELLQEKTRGNLDDEEERLLQSLLTELRMRYVEAGKG